MKKGEKITRGFSPYVCKIGNNESRETILMLFS